MSSVRQHRSGRSAPECPVCASTASREIFTADRQPATLNRLYTTSAEATHAATADLRFRVCEACAFVWNAAFDQEAVEYAPGYLNDQSCSPAFSSHLQRVRDRLLKAIAGIPGGILEIGCGQGAFLRDLCTAGDRRGIGFDPACAACNLRADLGGRVRVHGRRFDAALAMDDGPFALICCRHVLEHIPSPGDLIANIGRIAAASGAAVYLEVPCFEWIASHRAFFDLFHEHCSLFSPCSLARLLWDSGAASVRISHVFDGQYLAAEAQWPRKRIRPAAASACLPDVDTDTWAMALSEAREEANEWFHERRAASQPCVVWGAGAKGISLVNHVALDDSIVQGLVDIHPEKQNRYVPVTAQRVIAPDELPQMFGRRERPAIVIMNSNYADEIRSLLRSLAVQAHVSVIEGRPLRALHR